MSIVNKIKNFLRWYIKETKRKEIHPVIPQITIPNLLRDKVALVMGRPSENLIREANN